MAVLNKLRRNLLKFETVLVIALLILIYKYLLYESNDSNNTDFQRNSPKIIANKFQRSSVEESNEQKSIQWCSKLKYLNSTDGMITGLYSFPGSGNTWMRYLLQQVTGIYTGSIYDDKDLINSGFSECVVNSSVLVVKAHMWDKVSIFSRVVLVIRDIEKTLLAEFNRRRGNGHLDLATRDDFMTTFWKRYVKNIGNVWKQQHINLSYRYRGRIYMIRFEDLVDDLENTLRGVLKFLNFPVNEELMKCTLARSTGIFKRKKAESYFDPYIESMHEWLTNNQMEVFKKIRQKIVLTNRIKKLTLTKSDFEDALRHCPKEGSDDILQ